MKAAHSLHEAWADLSTTAANHLEALLAALGRLKAEEAERMHKAQQAELARSDLSEEVPVVLKRANTVDAADNAAKEAAAKAENELLPWVREQRERLQGQLKDVQAMALHAGGHHVGHAPSTAAGPASPGGLVRRASRPMKRQATAHMKLAAEAEALSEFVDEEMPPKKGDLLELRGTVHAALATRQIQRYEGSGNNLAPPATKKSGKNTAFVFAKPHANTPAVLEVIKGSFAEKGITILKEGIVTGEEIDSNGYIDQHYYAIAEKSTLTSGKDLPVNADKFKGMFDEDWATVVAEGRAFNALEFKKKFGQFAEEGALDKAWDATSVDKKTRVKLGGGFYCGQIEVEGTKYYTFNAFFMTMRGKFTTPGTSIHYYVVEFDPSTLSWEDFRGKVLGPTDPKDAPEGSLRGIIAADWEKLGLKAPL